MLRRLGLFSLLTLVLVIAAFNTPRESGAAHFTLAPAASMSSARADHTATLLRDGRVLIAGGMAENGVFLASAELFDPKTGRFSELPPMSRPRVGHSAALLPDGRVLIAGGLSSRHLTDQGWRGTLESTTEFFDPKTGKFSAGPAMAASLESSPAVVLASGKALLIGGFREDESTLDTAELYDPATNRFTVTGPLPMATGGGAAVLLKDGRVLTCGGSASMREVLDTCAIYDPQRNTWRAAGKMTVPRRKHDMVALDDGRVLIIGGSDNQDWQGQYDTAEIFDPARGKTVATVRMNSKRFKLPETSVVLKNGKIFVAGGSTQPEVFDPHTGKFAAVSEQYPEPVYFAKATLLADGRVLVTGGYGTGRGSSSGPRSTQRAWMFTP